MIDDNEAHNFVIYIRKCREEKGISQVEMAEGNGETAYICSTRAYSNIENGKIIPRLDQIIGFLKKVGKTIRDATEEMEKEEVIRFNNAVEEISKIIQKGAYDEARSAYLALLSENYYAKGLTRYKQPLMMLDAIINKHSEEETVASNKRALKGLKDALRLTRPELMRGSREKLQVEIISSAHDYTLIEYQILCNIAELKSVLKKREHAVEIYEAILHSLEYERVDMFVRKRIDALACFNLSNILIVEGEWARALEIIDRGLERELYFQSARVTGKLFANKAEVYMHIGDIEKSQKMFSYACNYFVMINEEKNAERIKKYVLKTFGVSIA